MRREWSFPYQWFYNCPGLKKTQRAIRKWPGHIAEAGRWLLALENKEGWHGLQAKQILPQIRWQTELVKSIESKKNLSFISLCLLSSYCTWYVRRELVFLSVFRFLTNCRKFFFFFRLKFVCTRSTKEFLTTSLNVSVRFRSNWNLEVLVNMKSGKPEYPEKKLSDQRKEPTTNSTHIWCWRRIRTQAILVGGKCSHRCATKLRSYNM